MKSLFTGSFVYLIALLATGAAALIRYEVGDLAGRGPLGPFFLAILLAGWLGGLLPGLFATIISTLLASVFFVDRTGLAFNDPGDAIAVALLLGSGLLTSWLCEIAHRRGRRLHAQEQALRAGQKRLEESEELYRLLTEAQPGMVWTLRPDNTVDYVNSAWVAFTGRTLQGIDADGWRDLIHPDDRAAMSNTISTPLERGEPHEVQVRFRRHDGVYRRVLSRVVPVRDGSGTVVKWIGTTTDIHDLWLARKGLRESTARLQESEKRFSNVASAPVMIWSSGPDRRCDWFNESWLAFTGRTLDQELGDGWREGVHPQDRERCFDTYVRAFDGRQPFTMEYRLRHRDGTYRRILDEGVPRSIEGRFYGYIGSAVDVTEQRLIEEQMLQAKKMEAVGQLAGGVAHDFNNLLTIINGYTDLMLARFTAEDTTRHDLEEVRIAGQRAASLTSQLLAFGRRQAMQPTVLDIDEEVAESAKTLRRVFGPDVEITVESDGARAQARVDRSQFTQVLLNLAVNAREAMPDGGRLTFATSIIEFGGADGNRHPRLRPRRYVRLAISDTGRGMTPEVKARIFEPFFTTKEFGKGSGLGLSVVHGIVEQSSGHIEVESEPGHGARVFIYLPCVGDVS